MSETRSFRDLAVWRLSMDLVEAVYALTTMFPKTEEYRLTSQLIRAAVSIPANIAEGQRRGTRKYYAHFISIARGSAAELEALLMIAARVKLANSGKIDPLIGRSDEVSRMLYALRNRLVERV